MSMRLVSPQLHNQSAINIGQSSRVPMGLSIQWARSGAPSLFWGPCSNVCNWYFGSLHGGKADETWSTIDRSSPTPAEVQNAWSHTSVTPLCPHGMDRTDLHFKHCKKLKDDHVRSRILRIRRKLFLTTKRNRTEWNRNYATVGSQGELLVNYKWRRLADVLLP